MDLHTAFPNKLQRGRIVIEAEGRSISASGRVGFERLQRGRLVSEAEGVCLWLDVHPSGSLQRGRLVSEAEGPAAR